MGQKVWRQMHHILSFRLILRYLESTSALYTFEDAQVVVLKKGVFKVRFCPQCCVCFVLFWRNWAFDATTESPVLM